MTIKKLIPCAAFLALGFASCSDNDSSSNPGGRVPTGEETSITLSISNPEITRASDANAVDAETKLNTVDVFIFDGSDLVKYERLYDTDFVDGNDDNEYTSDKEIKTTTGPKDIYVGVNLPSDMVSKINTAATTAGLHAVQQVSAAILTEGNGFVMFSKKPETKILVTKSDPAWATTNRISAQVERLAAKVTVERGSTLSNSVAGGTIDDLQFTIRNGNLKGYTYRNVVSGTHLDPNYYDNSYVSTDFEQAYGGYVAIGQAGQSVAVLNTKYTAENTTEKIYQYETTYASLRAVYTPEKFFNADGTEKGAGSATTFYTVREEDGSLKYFDIEADALAYAGSIGSTVSDPYVNGLCYYNMFLNPDGRYQTIRNTYYKIIVGKIYGLGNPNPEDEGDGKEPVKEPTTIMIDVEVLPWSFVEYEYEL